VWRNRVVVRPFCPVLGQSNGCGPSFLTLENLKVKGLANPLESAIVSCSPVSKRYKHPKWSPRLGRKINNFANQLLRDTSSAKYRFHEKLLNVQESVPMNKKRPADFFVTRSVMDFSSMHC
jgi:hypothetical protein